MSVREDALDAVLRSRRAVMTERGGVSVPAHFGSPMAELAACVRGVGVANRSDLGKIVLTGPQASVQALVRRHAGVALAPEGVAATSEGWWCGHEVDRVLVLARPGLRARLHNALRQEARQLGVTVLDASGALASLALAGRRMHHLLALLGIVPPSGTLRCLPPYSTIELAGNRVNLLLESDYRALLITDAGHADEVWQAAETTGRQLGLSLVGIDALERFVIFEGLHLERAVAV